MTSILLWFCVKSMALPFTCNSMTMLVSLSNISSKTTTFSFSDLAYSTQALVGGGKEHLVHTACARAPNLSHKAMWTMAENVTISVGTVRRCNYKCYYLVLTVESPSSRSTERCNWFTFSISSCEITVEGQCSSKPKQIYLGKQSPTATQMYPFTHR